LRRGLLASASFPISAITLLSLYQNAATAYSALSCLELPRQGPLA
jgi:hypothetical protein